MWLNIRKYKEHKNYRVTSVKCHLIIGLEFLKITCLNWSPWHAIHSVIMIKKIAHNCTKAHKLPPMLQYSSYSLVPNTITLREETATDKCLVQSYS